MKILIVGAGGQGGACASIMARNDKVEKITLVDLKKDTADEIKSHITAGQDKVETGSVDAMNPDDVSKMAKNADVVVDMVMPWMVPNVMKGALKVGANYINTAFDAPYWEMMRNGTAPDDLPLSKEFKDAGLTALFGCGFAPGWTNILARRFANRLDSVDTIKMRVGKLTKVPGETPTDWMFRPYNPGWSPKQALIDCADPTFAFVDGAFVKFEPYGGIEEWEFPEPMGVLPVSHHSHEEDYSMPYTFDGIKNVEFKYNIMPQPAIFYTMGLLSREEKEVNGVKVVPLDVVASCVPSPSAGVFGPTDEQLAYADKTNFLELVVQVSGMKDGKQVTWRANCPKMNAPGPELKKLFGTALVYVALPLAVGTEILGTTEQKKGIVFADQLDPEDFIKRMLETGYPYKWKETEF